MARETSKKQEQLSLPELEAFPLPTPSAQPVTDKVFSPTAAEAPAETEAVAKRRKPATPRRARTRMVLVSDTTQAETLVAAAIPVANAEPIEPAAPVAPAEFAATPLPAAFSANETQVAIAAAPVPSATPASSEAPLKRAAYLATLAAAGVAIIVLIAGASQFAQTQNAQRASIALHDETLRLERDTRQAETHAKAVELFMKYNELMLQLNVPLPKGAKRETRYWKENLALGLLDALANLTRGNREWENTIAWALERHLRFIRDQRAACSAYSDEFIRLLEKAASTKASALCRDNAQAE